MKRLCEIEVRLETPLLTPSFLSKRSASIKVDPLKESKKDGHPYGCLSSTSLPR